MIATPSSSSIVYQAAELKGEYPISFGDAFALVTTLNHSAILVTGDPDFKKVANLIKIYWV
ncbi:MAG: PIN domain-containing protein [Deltaproteobacteria bacterium]|nr:PIN domain-containing protein [Deltaproteobacteria bacterium]